MSLPAAHAQRPADLGLTPHGQGVYELVTSRSGKVVGRRGLVRGSGRSVLSEQRLTLLVASVRRSAGSARLRPVRGRGWRYHPPPPID